MTKQEVYDKVKAHLLTQNAKSTIPSKLGPVCVYRAPDGMKCAVGVLITDEHYKPELENMSPLAENVRSVLLASGCDLAQTEDGAQFLDDLQQIHDTRDPDEWLHELNDFAVTRGLNP